MLPVVIFHVLPLKLYGVACNQAIASLAPVIKSVPVTHSLPVAFANVNVGGVISTRIAFADPVTAYLPAQSFA